VRFPNVLFHIGWALPCLLVFQTLINVYNSSYASWGVLGDDFWQYSRTNALFMLRSTMILIGIAGNVTGNTIYPSRTENFTLLTVPPDQLVIVKSLNDSKCYL
jgi:hypothetical protein